ncbi:hypothetical protein L6452_07046 [Arctium lappa]|uniref:Uncharacterized protein n=1 Tax=Arctium lappa TaxID=4217 RepID=A0ACB9EK77_ARCLA|nr:hypothetical protein L6452_07046 [Arctium lappa]
MGLQSPDSKKIVDIGHGPSTLARKLFTWRNRDRGQLRHSNNDPRFVPSGVCTMRSADYGQLGTPQSAGNIPLCIEGLRDNYIKEIACGSHHVAFLNSNFEVYTWGREQKGG